MLAVVWRYVVTPTLCVVFSLSPEETAALRGDGTSLVVLCSAFLGTGIAGHVVNRYKLGKGDQNGER